MMVRITVESDNRVVTEISVVPLGDGYEIFKAVVEKSKRNVKRIGAARSLLQALVFLAPHVERGINAEI